MAFMYPQYSMYPQSVLPQAQAQIPVQQTQPMQQQIQNGGFVSVRSEDEAKNYPVALGNSVTFKDENAPYIYTKTMGFSQLDRPIFEKYKLVKEMPTEAPKLTEKASEDVNSTNASIDEIKAEIKRIWSAIDKMKEEEAEGV